MNQCLGIMLAVILDGAGVYGSALHYSMTIAMVGSALLLFVYFWRKGRLDLDEEPAIEMMKETEDADGPGK